MTCSVSFENVSVRYATTTKPSLKQINIECSTGEWILLEGPNGSGKSTLLRTLAGLIPQYFHASLEGELLLNEDSLHGRSIADRSLDIGMITSAPSEQLCTTTIRDEVALGLQLQGLDDIEVQKRVHSSLSAVGLVDRLDSSPISLSGGEQQRLILACFLARRPKILLLDEPLSQLDQEQAVKFIKHLFELKSEWKPYSSRCRTPLGKLDTVH